MNREEELALFRQAGEFEAKALELVRAIPEARRGPLPHGAKTSGPLRERVRRIVGRLQEEDPCDLSRAACHQIHQADELYWKMVLQWDRMVMKECWGKPAQEDTMQEARYGMYRACLRFDPSKGFRFSTYASNWMRQTIRVFTSEEVPSMKVSRRDQESRARLYQAQRHLSEKNQRDVSWEEAAEWIGMDKREFERALEATLCGVTSLDTPLEDGRTVGDVFSTDWESPVEAMENAEEIELVDALINELDERERFVVTQHFLAPEPMNFRELGDELGLSRERVRQILARALRKLRDAEVFEKGLPSVRLRKELRASRRAKPQPPAPKPEKKRARKKKQEAPLEPPPEHLMILLVEAEETESALTSRQRDIEEEISFLKDELKNSQEEADKVRQAIRLLRRLSEM